MKILLCEIQDKQIAAIQKMLAVVGIPIDGYRKEFLPSAVAQEATGNPSYWQTTRQINVRIVDNNAGASKMR